MKSGFVSIIGRPNVGKSTLLNKLINKKIAITSDKVGTTRNIIYGIYNEEDVQIIFIDTPGIQKANNKLEETLNKLAYSSLDNDLVLFLIDASTGFSKKDEKVLEKLKQDKKDVILIINKIDKIDKEELFNLITDLKDLYPFKDIVPISSLKGKNISELIKVVKTHLKDDIKYFSDDDITNVSEKFLASEIVREKVLILTKEEVPHSVTTLTEEISFKKDSLYIRVLIIVDKENLKRIIVGKNATMLKNIGSLARKDLEEFFNKKVYLELFVKTMKDWRQKENLLKELGISELE